MQIEFLLKATEVHVNLFIVLLTLILIELYQVCMGSEMEEDVSIGIMKIQNPM